MKRILLAIMIMCAVARGECYKSNGGYDLVEGECYIKKITKENVIKDIKAQCLGDKYGEYSLTICDYFSPTRRNTQRFVEVERILQELSTFKVPQNIPSVYQRAIKTIVQDIYKDIQKVYNDKDGYVVGGEIFELVKNYKTLTAKYANTPITQAMINPLKTSAQQQHNTLVKLEEQREKLEKQQREEIESRSEIQPLLAKKDSLLEKSEQLQSELYRLEEIERKLRFSSRFQDRRGLPDYEKLRNDKEYSVINKEIGVIFKEYMAIEKEIRKEIGELSDKIPAPQGSPELDAQIAAKEGELSLLSQEILFLEMQKEIQKVEKMSQAQLTQYVIQHSVCSKKQLGEQESGGASGRGASWCADREGIIADAKKGWYDPSYLFTPLYSPYIPFRGVWEDEEGNRWSEEYNGYDIIIERAFALNDIAQALKNNDMQKLYNSLKYFEQFAKNKERDFLSQLIEQIKRTYKIDSVIH